MDIHSCSEASIEVLRHAPGWIRRCEHEGGRSEWQDAGNDVTPILANQQHRAPVLLKTHFSTVITVINAATI